MRFILTLIFIFSVYQTANGQGKNAVKSLQQENTRWHKGTLYLRDESLLKGDVQYNEKNGALSFKVDEVSESYSANTVLKFDFYNPETKKQQNYISLDYPMEKLMKGIVKSHSLSDSNNDQSNDATSPTFFEVLKETSQFALLSKVKPIEYREKPTGGFSFNSVTGGVSGGPVNVYDEIKQSEIIFFLDKDGNLTPYIEFVNKETYNTSFKDSKPGKSTRKIKIDADLLQEMTGEFYPNLMDYAKTNNLKSTRREDLLKIIDYYISLESKAKSNFQRI